MITLISGPARGDRGIMQGIFEAMHEKGCGFYCVVYLKISCDEMVRRLNNITTRGIVLFSGESLPDMYHERVLLYEKYADITVDCEDEDFEEVVVGVITGMGG